MTGIVLPPPALILVVSTRYDVTISHAMPDRWQDFAAGIVWSWTVRLDGGLIESGYTYTERGAERAAKRAARRHHRRRPPKHVPPRTYSINL